MDIPYIDIHTHRHDPTPGVERLSAYRLGQGLPPPRGVFTAGVHPWDAEKVDLSALDFFRDPPPGLVGVGEIGLDFAIRDADRAVQAEGFVRQLVIAGRLGLPVVLHCVRAYNEVQAELKKQRPRAVVFHGFNGSPELAHQLTGQGYCLSFSAFTLRSPRAIEALKATPPNRLFLETDDDPHAAIGSLYGEAAALRGTTVGELRAVIFNNYQNVFCV